MSLINSSSEPFPPIDLRRRHAQTVRDISSSNKIDYVIVIKNFLNLKGHHNPIDGSKVTAILLKVRILPIGGASAVESLRSTGLPRLVCYTSLQTYTAHYIEQERTSISSILLHCLEIQQW